MEDKISRWILRTVPGWLVHFFWIGLVWWFTINQLPWVKVTEVGNRTQHQTIGLLTLVTWSIATVTDWLYFRLSFSVNIIGVIFHQIFKLATTFASFWVLSFWAKWITFMYPEGYSHIIVWLIIGFCMISLRVYDIRYIILRYIKIHSEEKHSVSEK